MNKNYWCGIRGVYQIWHGQWADPEVRYKNYICNEWDLQESMYTYMKERIADGEDWGDPDNDNDFANFCRKHADMVKSDIIDFSEAMYESKNIMLRKDKALLESLTKRYGKNNVLNELEDETISNAFIRAKNEYRWQQAKTFADEIYNRKKKKFDKIKLELELEPIFRGVDCEDVVVKIFISKDKNNPIAFIYNDTPGVENVGVITPKSYEDDLNEYYFKIILNKFNQLTTNDIQYDTDESYLYHIPQNKIEDYLQHFFNDKKTAREFVNAINILNNLFDVNVSTNWHIYHNQGRQEDYGFDEKGNYLREGYENKQDKIVSLYKREIFNYLDSLKWDNLYDIIYEFGYGDEYHELVEDIMDALGLDEMEEHYDYLYPYMERIIKEYLIKNKMWR